SIIFTHSSRYLAMERVDLSIMSCSRWRLLRVQPGGRYGCSSHRWEVWSPAEPSGVGAVKVGVAIMVTPPTPFPTHTRAGPFLRLAPEPAPAGCVRPGN